MKSANETKNRRRDSQAVILVSYLGVCLLSRDLLNADQLQAREAWVSHVIHNVNFMLSETVWQVLPHFTSGNQSEGQHVRERDNLMV